MLDWIFINLSPETGTNCVYSVLPACLDTALAFRVSPASAVQILPSIQQIRQSYLKPPLPDGRLRVRPRPQGWPAWPAAPRLQEPPGAVFKPRPPRSCQPPARCSRGLAPSSSSGGWFPGHPEVLRIPTRSPGRSPAGDAHGPAPRLPGPHPPGRLSHLCCHCPSISLLGHGPDGLGLEGAEGS